ncbi:hypothetical protein HG421_20240 [Xanthomonas campestris pv. badrii]|uniref:Uncharacterized protein n=1 Tax=Xanthomonas campestris pv. badrii TaxID=149696 RepID=A0A7Z2VE36_XANCA|nr:hypothetical protein [Xanthomonas campestris]QJD69785.1 hypothetical protein HG421_20240 [Xanthomonas campestris pv. badrii]
MQLTNFFVMDFNGDVIEADATGHHVAFCCFNCFHPFIANALEGQRGSDEEHLAFCKGCNTGYFLDVRPATEKLYVHNADNIGTSFDLSALDP